MNPNTNPCARRLTGIVLLLSVSIVLLFFLSLVHGSVTIPVSEVGRIMLGGDSQESWHFIIMETRLPQALTAWLAGGALAVSGLLLQTAFGNPLAAPDIFGVTSGASLAVALLTLAPVAVLPVALSYLSSVAAAFLGAIAVTALIFALSRWVHSPVVLMVVGIMVGYLASSFITLLNFFATEQGVKNFAVWGMGNFGNVPMDEMPVFAALTLLATGVAFLLVKPLNALLLGERYAENLGVNVKWLRRELLLLTGLLTAVVTAFCGPIAFVALAVPHIARLLVRTSDHGRLLLVTVLTGQAVTLLCNVLTTLPGGLGVLPLNAVTPLVGAPVIIYVLLAKKT
jgi:iron complex transport system permease protein